MGLAGSRAAASRRKARQYARSEARDLGDHAHREAHGDAVSDLEVRRTFARADSAGDGGRAVVLEGQREVQVAIPVDVQKSDGLNDAGSSLGKKQAHGPSLRCAP